MSKESTDPKSIASCESFLLDLIRSIEETEAQNNAKYSKARSDIQQQDSSNTLQRLYNSLKYQNIPVECRVCERGGVEGTARAFISAPPLRITLCANRLKGNDYAEALTHEATHAFDYINSSCDFSSCDGLAYSEIRAARNAECADSFTFMKEGCIKRQATRATSNIFPQNASECVARMFDKAIADIRP